MPLIRYICAWQTHLKQPSVLQTYNGDLCFLPVSEELSNSEEVHRWSTGTLHHQRHLSCKAVQQSAVQEKRQMCSQELGLGRLPAPEPALLSHSPQCSAQRSPLPCERSPQQPRHPGHEAQIHLPVLSGLGGCILRGSPGKASSSPGAARRPCASPPRGQPAERHPALSIPTFLLSVCHHVPGALSYYQVSDTVEGKAERSVETAVKAGCEAQIVAHLHLRCCMLRIHYISKQGDALYNRPQGQSVGRK